MLFCWQNSTFALHWFDSLNDVVPDLILSALPSEHQKVLHTDEFKMNRISIVVLVPELRRSTPSFCLCQRRLPAAGFENDYPFLAYTSNSRISVHDNPILEE